MGSGKSKEFTEFKNLTKVLTKKYPDYQVHYDCDISIIPTGCPIKDKNSVTHPPITHQYIYLNHLKWLGTIKLERGHSGVIRINGHIIEISELLSYVEKFIELFRFYRDMITKLIELEFSCRWISQKGNSLLIFNRCVNMTFSIDTEIFSPDQTKSCWDLLMEKIVDSQSCLLNQESINIPETKLLGEVISIIDRRTLILNVVINF